MNMGNINQNADLIANNQYSNPSEKESSLSEEFEKKIQLIFSKQFQSLRDDMKAIFSEQSKTLREDMKEIFSEQSKTLRDDMKAIFSEQSKTLRDDLKAIFTEHSKQLMVNLSIKSKEFENKLITALVTQYNLVSGNLIINQNRGVGGPEVAKSKKK